MAMGRLNRPSMMVYGGTIKPGFGKKDCPLDIVSAFQCYGEFIAGASTRTSVATSCATPVRAPAPAAGMYTANTMASAIEALGMSLPYSSSTPAEDPGQARRVSSGRRRDPPPARARHQAPRHHDARGLRERHGGRDGARRLHQRGAAPDRDGAGSVGVELGIDDFQSVSDRIPFLADLKPSGRYVMEDLHDVGGTPARAQDAARARGAMHGDCSP